MGKTVLLESIKIDGGTQGREAINGDHVADLKAAWESKSEIPPILVYFDGTDYWLADGFHRYHAATQAGLKKIAADVRNGTQRDAWLASLGANQGHGLKRTNEDKRKLVRSAMADDELVHWSDRRIADTIGVSHNFVSEIRSQLSSDDNSNAAKAAGTPKKGKDGKKYPAKKPPTQSDAPPADKDDDWLNDHVRSGPEMVNDPTKPQDKGKISGGTTFDPAELTSESKDAFGEQVSVTLEPVFELCEEFDAQRHKLTGIKSWLTQREAHPGAAVLVAAAQRLRTAIDDADAELRFSRPHCECVYCRNQPPKVHNCTACKGLGWMTKPVYDAAPKDMKRAKVKG